MERRIREPYVRCDGRGGNLISPLPYWMEHLKEFASSSQSLKALFPEGGFALQGLSNLFGVPGIALAFYATAKKAK